VGFGHAFGLKNAPPMYWNTINKSFLEYLDVFMLFLDDFTLFSDMDTHFPKLTKCFEKCMEFGIILNPDLSTFGHF
jgi:hypothetical protein